MCTVVEGWKGVMNKALSAACGPGLPNASIFDLYHPYLITPFLLGFGLDVFVCCSVVMTTFQFQGWDDKHVTRLAQRM